MSDFDAILERLRKLEASEEVHNDVEESRMGYSDVEKLGSAAASKVDNVLRRKIYNMGKDIRDIEPGTLDRMRYQVAKELGLVESSEETELDAVEEGYYNDEEKYVDHSFNKMLDFVNTATKMVEKPRLADNITSIGGDPSSLKDIKQKLDDLYNNVEDGHYEAMAHLGMEESEEAIEPMDMREQRLAQRVNELTKRLQSFKEQLSEMDPEMDPEEIKQQQTITSNLNQLKSAGVDIDPNKGTDDPTFNKEIGDKVAAAMADPALANQVKGVLSKVKD